MRALNRVGAVRGRIALVFAVATAAAALLAARTLDGIPPSTGHDALTPPIAAASSTGKRPSCAAAARQVVRQFTQAVTQGNADGADKTFAKEPAFQWYSTTAPGARVNATARDRTTLRGYFRERVARRERLRLTQLTARYERRRNITNFHGTLARTADDIPTTIHRFKGAAACGRRTRIVVWSMASGGESR